MGTGVFATGVQLTCLPCCLDAAVPAGVDAAAVGHRECAVSAAAVRGLIPAGARHNPAVGRVGLHGKRGWVCG